jgi:hypothetical protein
MNRQVAKSAKEENERKKEGKAFPWGGHVLLVYSLSSLVPFLAFLAVHLLSGS